jgi:hypothetical protein
MSKQLDSGESGKGLFDGILIQQPIGWMMAKSKILHTILSEKAPLALYRTKYQLLIII